MDCTHSMTRRVSSLPTTSVYTASVEHHSASTNIIVFVQSIARINAPDEKTFCSSKPQSFLHQETNVVISWATSELLWHVVGSSLAYFVIMVDHLSHCHPGHCRRRKIRCVPSATVDPQGRCANCIRLKKECNFTPVDHQSDARLGRQEMGSTSASSKSSPQLPLAQGQVPTTENHAQSTYDHTAPIPIPIANTSLSSHYVPGFMSHDTVLQQPRLEFSQTNLSPQWQAPEYNGPAGLHSPYWASAESTPIRPNFPQHLLAAHESSTSHELAGQYHQGSQHWLHRSTSFSNYTGPSQEFPHAAMQSAPESHRAGIQYQTDTNTSSAGSGALSPEATFHLQNLPSTDNFVPGSIPYPQQWSHDAGSATAQGQQWYGSQHDAIASDPGQMPYATIPQQFFTNVSQPD